MMLDSCICCGSPDIPILGWRLTTTRDLMEAYPDRVTMVCGVECRRTLLAIARGRKEDLESGQPKLDRVRQIRREIVRADTRKYEF